MEDEQLPARFGEVVRALRQKQGLSQEKLAEVAGIDRAYMGGLERGRRNPSLTTLARVAAGLDMKLSQILREVEKAP